jgi:DNA-3-methyladenine glycosylase I
MNVKRCSWANSANPLYLDYHDNEWGRPCHDENRLFEMLNLEGAQAGLSWETVLNKRASYRIAFDDWDAKKSHSTTPKRSRNYWLIPASCVIV